VKPTVKLAIFVLVLLGAFGTGAALGAALPDLGPKPAVHQDGGGHG